MFNQWDKLLANENSGAGDMWTGLGTALMYMGQGGGPVRPRFDAQAASMFQNAMQAPRRASMFDQQRELSQLQMQKLRAETDALQNPKPKVPPGYEMGPNGRLQPMSGGPADLGTIAAQANAKNPYFFQQIRMPDNSVQTIAIPRSALSAQSPGAQGALSSAQAPGAQGAQPAAAGIPGAVTLSDSPDPAAIKALRDQTSKLDQVQDSLTRYKALLNKHGAEVMPGPPKAALQTAYTETLMEMKELFNLGVLNGPDLDLMTRLLKDPASIGGKFTEIFGGGLPSFNAQIDVVQKKLDAARDRAKRIYGGGPPDDQSRAPLPATTPEAGQGINVETAPISEVRKNLDKLTPQQRETLERRLKGLGY